MQLLVQYDKCGKPRGSLWVSKCSPNVPTLIAPPFLENPQIVARPRAVSISAAGALEGLPFQPSSLIKSHSDKQRKSLVIGISAALGGGSLCVLTLCRHLWCEAEAAAHSEECVSSIWC